MILSMKQTTWMDCLMVLAQVDTDTKTQMQKEAERGMKKFMLLALLTVRLMLRSEGVRVIPFRMEVEEGLLLLHFIREENHVTPIQTVRDIIMVQCVKQVLRRIAVPC